MIPSSTTGTTDRSSQHPASPPASQPNLDLHPDIGPIVETFRLHSIPSLILVWLIAPLFLMIALGGVGAAIYFPSIGSILFGIGFPALTAYIIRLLYLEGRKHIDLGLLGARLRIAHRPAQTVLYKDADGFAYYALTQSVNLIPVSKVLVFKLKQKKRRAISFHRSLNFISAPKVPSFLPTVGPLDHVRDLAASAIAHRMFNDLMASGTINWTSRLQFEGDTLAYKPILGSRRTIDLDLANCKVDGVFLVVFNETTRESFASISIMDELAWPGLVLFLRLKGQLPMHQI